MRKQKIITLLTIMLIVLATAGCSSSKPLFADQNAAKAAVPSETPTEVIPPTPTLFPTVAAVLPVPNMAPAMIYHSAVYEESAKQILIFGGNSRHGFNADVKELFSYDPESGQWGEARAFEANPPWKSAMAPAYDAESDRVIFFNVVGETWAYDYDTDTWELMEPASAPTGRCGHQMSYDSESDRIIMYGGFRCNSTADPPIDENWAYDYNTNTWTSLSTGPSGRMYHEMAYDSESDRVVMWGGRPHQETDQTDIWAYDFNTDTWASYPVENGPSRRSTYHTMTYIPELDRIIVYGGVALKSMMGGDFSTDVWEYDLNNNAWTQIETDTSPPPLAKQVMTYDPGTGLLYMFGGSRGVLYADEYISFEFWSYDPLAHTWTNLLPED